MEITLRSGPLTEAMRAYGLNILWLSLVISLTTAAMVFFAVAPRRVVRPITDVIENVKAFSENPEDANRGSSNRPAASARSPRPSKPVADMQRDVHAALKSRARLASLGEAVAKISHDLRNILATTQLMADRLEMSQDPIVSRTAPKTLVLAGPRDPALPVDPDLWPRRGSPARERRNVALADLGRAT